MIRALKITADRIALSGVARCIKFNTCNCGYVDANAAGIMAKYFETSFAMLNVVNDPLVISSCFPISTISISFVGLLSRSTILAASRAGCVPVFMATATSACASAGASLVPSPVMATSLPLFWYWRISASFFSGVACARKSSTPASAAIAAAVSGLSPVIMTVLIPIRRSWAKRSFSPPLTMSLRWMIPNGFPFSTTIKGVPPLRAMESTSWWSCSRCSVYPQFSR